MGLLIENVRKITNGDDYNQIGISKYVIDKIYEHADLFLSKAVFSSEELDMEDISKLESEGFTVSSYSFEINDCYVVSWEKYF